MVRAAGSTDYNMVLQVGSGRCSQLSPDIRTAGTSEWSSDPGVVRRQVETNKTPTTYALYAVQNLVKLWHLLGLKTHVHEIEMRSATLT